MRISAVLTPVFVTAFSATALMLAGCDRTSENPSASASADVASSASGAIVDDAVGDNPSDAATGASAESQLPALDMGALMERKDPERLLRYYISAIRNKDWTSAAKAWTLDAQMTPEKLEAEFGGQAGPRLAVGKGDSASAAGSVYYEAPLVIDFTDGRPAKRGTIVLRRVNDAPGASAAQLNWRIERTSTLTQ